MIQSTKPHIYKVFKKSFADAILYFYCWYASIFKGAMNMPIVLAFSNLSKVTNRLMYLILIRYNRFDIDVIR